MADFLGQPLISRVLNATDGIFAKRVVVTRHESVAALCREREIPVILHTLPYRSDTVRLGLQWMGESVDGCLFCPGDQPLLRRESVARMACCADASHILRLSFGEIEGSPVFFPRRDFEELLALPQGKGGGVLLRKYPKRVRPVQAADVCELWDADTSEELETIKKMLSY